MTSSDTILYDTPMSMDETLEGQDAPQFFARWRYTKTATAQKGDKKISQKGDKLVEKATN